MLRQRAFSRQDCNGDIMHRVYAIRAISDLTDITFVQMKEGQVLRDEKGEKKEILRRLNTTRVRELVETLTEKAGQQNFPFLYIDDCGILWISVLEKDSGVTIIGGPVSISRMSVVDEHRFNTYYGLSDDRHDMIPYVTFNKVLASARILSMLLNQVEATDSMLVYGNHLSQDTHSRMREEKKVFDIEQEDAQEYHHSYQEERKLQEYIRSGQSGPAYDMNIHIMDAAGLMGQDAKSHWYNLSIAAITLSTRAAIEGGLSPAEAYSLSDYYMQQIHMGDSVVELQRISTTAMIDLTDRVHEIRQQKRFGYAYRCKDFVAKHYKEKIYLADAAEALGISEGYLSRTFRKEEGVTFQQYLLQFRLERAANLLKYSDSTIGEISTYVNFPSQSYFSEQFRKYMEMSPGEYRRRFKPVEFTGSTEE